MKEKIIQLLNDAEEYISGEEISNQLGVSRTAIWKVIKQLREQGYEIESITRKGYKLVKSPDVLKSEEIRYNLNTKLLGKKVITFDTLESTNKEAKRFAIEGENEGTVIISEEQTSGKGRRGKDWISPPNSGIWMSIILRPEIIVQNASMLTLVAGLAVCKAIQEETKLNVEIKWPNDIILDEKKVGGILTEMSSEIDFINFIIVGIGINVNIPSFPEEISNVATSLLINGKKNYKRKNIVKKILEYFEIYYNKYLQTEDLTYLIEEYNKYCINIGRDVKIINKNEVLIAKAKEVTTSGELVVIDDNGKEVIINSGEVSVRGLNGYV